MSNYHIMRVTQKKDQADVVFHFAIPDTTNFAGVNFRAALVEHLTSGGETIASRYPGIDGGELTQLQAGEVYEHSETVNFSALATDVQKRDAIDARWTALNSVIPARVQDELNFWGYDRDVP